MRTFAWIAGLALILAPCGAIAQERPVLGRNGGAPVRAEAPVTEESLAGRWGDNGDCNAATEYNSDGSFSSSSGEGRWSLSGDHLTLQSESGVADYAVLMMNADTIRFTGADGAVKYQRRC